MAEKRLSLLCLALGRVQLVWDTEPHGVNRAG